MQNNMETMNLSKNLDIEVCLRPWVTLLPFCNSRTKTYERKGTNVGFAEILQILKVSIVFYLEKVIELQPNTNIFLRPTKINGNIFQKYFDMNFLEGKEISSEEGAFLLLHEMDINSQFDSFQIKIIVEGCIQVISVGDIFQKRSYYNHMRLNYSNRIKDILFNGPHVDNKEKVIFLVPPFLHQQKSSMSFKLLKPKCTEASQISKNRDRKECTYINRINFAGKRFLSTDSVNVNYVFFQCPEEQARELENGPLDSIIDIINLYNGIIEGKGNYDIEGQLRNTYFKKESTENKNCSTRKIYEDPSSEEEYGIDQTNNMYLGYSKSFQPKLTKALLDLNKSIPMENISMRASDFITITPLPNEKLIGSWEKLKMKDNLKQRIYNTIKVLLCLSNILNSKKSFVDETFSAQDKLILLHGPPGTGKSSLARAIFQKFSVKVVNSIKDPIDLPPILLLELAPDKIYSRYYGESPKKLSMLFTAIETTLRKGIHGGFIFMIIDEIESLATERSTLITNNETTDGVRMVNILLTHLDKLRHYKNFFMIGTSNLIESVDSAFKDRASALYKIPLPNEEIIYSILEQQITHFLDLGFLYQKSGLDSKSTTSTTPCSSSLNQYSSKLLSQIAAYCSVSLPFLHPREVHKINQ